MDGFQKFLRMVDGHETTYFCLQYVFWPVIFWSFFKISWIKKMAGAKTVVKLKNQFFHARQPRKIIFDICTY